MFVRTDRLGRASLAVPAFPATIVVSQIGFAPETLSVDYARDPIEVLLEPTPVDLAALTVTAVAGGGLAPSVDGGWRLPAQVVRDVPLAAQTDPIRALILVPSISFSTPLSGRPILRGYDASDAVVRLDGFEVINPYHIGRIFSAFPADAVDALVVRPDPGAASDGETLAGTVDVLGRQSVGPRAGGGADVGVAAVSGWVGAGEENGVFVAGRIAFLEGVTELVGEPIPYAFQDGYGRARLRIGEMPWDLSAFASHDDYGDPSGGSGMGWTNVLVGNRWRVVDAMRASVDVALSANRFTLNGVNVDDGVNRIDMSNRFSRASLGITGFWSKGAVRLDAGGGVARRTIRSMIQVVGNAGTLPGVDARSTAVEAQGSMELRIASGGFVLAAGGRVDGSGLAVAWQPRVRVEYRAGRSMAMGVRFARSARLYHVITDPEPEPSVSFFDVWLNGGEGGVPVPRVDHVTAHVDLAGRGWSATVAAFRSQGTGLGELRPAWEPGNARAPYRFGDSRTLGLETRVAWRSGSQGPSVAVTYVLGSSDRRWDASGWRPWRVDRRHDIRVQAGIAVKNRWRFFAAGQFLSGQPLTPVTEVVWPDAPPLDGDTAGSWARLAYRYGPEGGDRSDATVHVDLGARLHFDGPGDSHMAVGLSVINIAFGPVAPSEPVSPGELLGPSGYDTSNGVPLRRRFSLPPVPAISIRIEF